MKSLRLTIRVIIFSSLFVMLLAGDSNAISDTCNPQAVGTCPKDEGYRMRGDGTKLRFDHDYGSGRSYFDVYTNTSGTEYFVPTKTWQEYDDFRTFAAGLSGVSRADGGCGDGICEVPSLREGCGSDDSMTAGEGSPLPRCNTDCGECPIVCGDGYCAAGTELCGDDDTAPACNSDCGCCVVNGSCDNATQNACSDGTANDNAVDDTARYWRWQCDGICGGTDDATCEKEKASCTSPCDTIVSGASCTAYQSSSVSCGSSCSSQTRTCDDGSLSGTYENASCSVTALDGSCDNTTQNACSDGTANDDAVDDTARYWRWQCDGSCGGTDDATCEKEKSSCSSPCGTIVSGASCTAYESSSVLCGSSCASETRTCDDGSLSGTYTNASCTATDFNSAQCAAPSSQVCGTAISDNCGNTSCPSGTAYNSGQCAAPSSQVCGTAISDNCGNTSCPSGTAYNSAQCAAPSSQACGTAISDNCGNTSCPTGTAYNSGQCPNPASYSCGTVLSDSCGNTSCPTGTAYNSGQCPNPASYSCGTVLSDSCGNTSCPSGTICQSDAACSSGSCVCNSGYTLRGNVCCPDACCGGLSPCSSCVASGACKNCCDWTCGDPNDTGAGCCEIAGLLPASNFCPDPPPPPPPPSCADQGESCNSTSDCCSGLTCFGGTCWF